MERPADLFDRRREWEALTEFVEADAPGARLAIVTGRRRQGKTFLLSALVEAYGGFLFSALEHSSSQNLARLSEQYTSFVASSAPIRFETWEEALRALLALGTRGDRPIPVVIDEFPYLLADAPELPSLLQDLLRPRGSAMTSWPTRLILCGSALSVMRSLMVGTAPLRGRAALELMVHPFDHREAALFWGIDDLDVAVRLHALLGGTPAYRTMSGADTAPTSRRFDTWVERHLLSPSSAMFREGHVLLSEETRITDASLYFSVLSTIAGGRTRRGEIAQGVGKTDTAINHPLAVLVEAGLVQVSEDPLRQRRSTFHLAEPILRFHQLVIAPNATLLGRGRAQQVWQSLSGTVGPQLYGPHFEQLARQWVTDHAAPETLGGLPTRVGTTTVACREHGTNHQIDVVCLEAPPGGGARILAIGEAKWNSRRLDAAAVARLEHLRALLPDAADARLLLFGRQPADAATARLDASRADLELVDLERLYHGG